MTAAPAATVLVVSHYYPPHVGGVENVARSEAEQLAEAGHRVEVLSTSPGAAPGTSVENGVLVHRVRAWNGIEERAGVPFPVPSPGLFLAAARSVRRAGVVHVHDTLYITSWLAAFWCVVLRRRLVVTQHVDRVAHPRFAVRAVQRLVYGTAGRGVLRAAYPCAAVDAHDPRFGKLVSDFSAGLAEGLPAELGTFSLSVAADLGQAYMQRGEYDHAAALLEAMLDHASATMSW